MTIMTQADQIAPRLSVTIFKPKRQGQLWMLLDMVHVMHGGCLGIFAFGFAVLALELVQLQRVPPRLLPRCPGVKGMHILVGDAVSYKVNLLFGHLSNRCSWINRAWYRISYFSPIRFNDWFIFFFYFNV